MTVVIFAVVFGWVFVLEQIVKAARVEAGMDKSAARHETWVWASFIPIIAMAGFCFPRVFLGKELAWKLKERGIKRRWFNRIRIGVVACLTLLIRVPLVLVMAGLH